MTHDEFCRRFESNIREQRNAIAAVRWDPRVETPEAYDARMPYARKQLQDVTEKLNEKRVQLCLSTKST